MTVPDARTLAKFDRTMAATRDLLVHLAAFAKDVQAHGPVTEFALVEDIGEQLSGLLPELVREISGPVDVEGLLGAAMGLIAVAAIGPVPASVYALQSAPPVGSVVTDGQRLYTRLDNPGGDRAYFRDLDAVPAVTSIPWPLLLEQRGPLRLVTG